MLTKGIVLLVLFCIGIYFDSKDKGGSGFIRLPDGNGFTAIGFYFSTIIVAIVFFVLWFIELLKNNL